MPMVLSPACLIRCVRVGHFGRAMRITVAIACASILIGCAREEPDRAAESAAARPAVNIPAPQPELTTIEPLPALYSGVLPCADCPGIRYDIDVRPANIYFLRMTYLDANSGRSYEDLGTWSLASDLRTLALRGSRQPPMLFSIVGRKALRKLNNEGQPIESELNYTLERSESYEALSPQVPLRGMYSKSDAGAVIEECTTGLRLTLSGESTESLATQFEALRKGANRPVLLAVEGRVRLTTTEPVSGTLVATSTAQFWPGESCGARGVTHDLEGSRWVLVRIGEKPFVPEEGRPEPYIVLQSSTKQIAGYGGCNRLSGGYRIQGDALEFGELTTTRIACPDLEDEHAFLNALDDVARWQLMDNQLVLFDKNRTPVLQLESRNL